CLETNAWSPTLQNPFPPARKPRPAELVTPVTSFAKVAAIRSTGPVPRGRFLRPSAPAFHEQYRCCETRTFFEPSHAVGFLSNHQSALGPPQKRRPATVNRLWRSRDKTPIGQSASKALDAQEVA